MADHVSEQIVATAKTALKVPSVISVTKCWSIGDRTVTRSAEAVIDLTVVRGAVEACECGVLIEHTAVALLRAISESPAKPDG